MAPYFESVFAYVEESSKAAPCICPHVDKLDANEHDPNKLTKIKKVKWEQTPIRHALLC